MKNANLLKKFKSLGWSNNAASQEVFKFLTTARKQIRTDQIILDLGAGECRYSFFFDKCYYVAVDFGQGDKKWNFSKLDILADITNLKFIKNKCIDFCLNTVTLEHIKEPHLFFKEVERILKPGGKLFLYAPFVVNEHQVPYDFFRFTSYGLRYLSDQSGLEIISLTPSNGALSTGISIAHYSLHLAAGKNIFVKIILFILRLFFDALLPICEKLDFYLQKREFPLLWLLIAKKRGKTLARGKKYLNKPKVIGSIICCPICGNKLNHLDNCLICKKCDKKFPKKNGKLNFLDY